MKYLGSNFGRTEYIAVEEFVHQVQRLVEKLTAMGMTIETGESVRWAIPR